MTFEHNWKNENGKDKRKCPAHNMWMKKGQCELCRMRLDEIQRKNIAEGGSNITPVKIKTF